MGITPVALAINPPQQPPSVDDQVGKLLQLKSLLQQQQLAPLRVQQAQQALQAGQLENQQRQFGIAQQQAIAQSYKDAVKPNADGVPQIDTDAIEKNILGSGYATTDVVEGLNKFNKSLIDIQTAKTDLQSKTNDLVGGAASAIKAANYDPRIAHTLLDSLPASPQLNALRAQIDNPQALKQWVDTSLAQSPKQTELGTAKEAADARMMAAGNSAGALASRAAQGDPQAIATLKQMQNQSAAVAAADQNARIPGQVAAAQAQLPIAVAKAAAEEKTRQAISQGDPATAGQLLADRTLTLQELKSRSVTPQFITAAIQQAQKIDPSFKAAESEGQAHVAASAANQQFFGNTDSLITKGGTLDQLDAAGKALGNKQVPAYNSLANWTKAAAGSGPQAAYAAAALGVADDYSKVMTGGQGSDHARQQALDIISKNQSPEQRAASIGQIRNQIQSQREGRIGSNPYLKNMYPNPAPQFKLPANAPTATGPNGHKIAAVNGKWVDAKTGEPVQ